MAKCSSVTVCINLTIFLISSRTGKGSRIRIWTEDIVQDSLPAKSFSSATHSPTENQLWNAIIHLAKSILFSAVVQNLPFFLVIKWTLQAHSALFIVPRSAFLMLSYTAEVQVATCSSTILIYTPSKTSTYLKHHRFLKQITHQFWLILELKQSSAGLINSQKRLNSTVRDI